ncbi:hypothetical protein [Angelakisella massiliensis]|uniref:hypothetical protein n=1 Tax=Angelakisella massiliensis TaxID=1871018 RepID=UPI0024B1AB5A|nr:hypothetical protein [Angelakisella massiliensis]
MKGGLFTDCFLKERKHTAAANNAFLLFPPSGDSSKKRREFFLNFQRFYQMAECAEAFAAGHPSKGIGRHRFKVKPVHWWDFIP